MNGQCFDDVSKFSCDCDPGFTGTFCNLDVDECSSNPCFNDAYCLDFLDKWICQCNPGFTGLKCEAESDECYRVVTLRLNFLLDF